MHAVRSGGITHAITAACSRGAMRTCGCDQATVEPGNSTRSGPVRRSPGDDWSWGGCGAEIDYALSLSRSFVDAREIEGVSQSLVNLHNNRVGRKVAGLCCY